MVFTFDFKMNHAVVFYAIGTLLNFRVACLTVETPTQTELLVGPGPECTAVREANRVTSP